jgi:hypothetical protein
VHPPPTGTPAPAPTAAAKTFLSNARRLKLDVSTLAPIHGPVTPWADFVKVMARTERDQGSLRDNGELEQEIIDLSLTSAQQGSLAARR